MRSILLPATLILIALFALVSRAQDDLLPPDEVQDIVERYVERGIESFRDGGYDEARLRFKKALKRDPKHAGARLGIVRCQMALGGYDEARDGLEQVLKEQVLKEQVLKENGDSIEAKLLLAAIDLREGKLTAVRAITRSLVAGGDELDLNGVRASYLLAASYAAGGKRMDAKDVLNRVVKHYKRRYDLLAQAAFDADQLRHEPDKARPLSEEMTVIAACMRLYVELYPLEYDFIENALELIGYARRLDESNWEAWIEYVRITRSERERAMARARKARDTVIKRNPELADLYVEVAKSLGVGWNQSEVRKMANSALVINPSHAGAHSILAKILMEDNVYDKAREHLDKALAVNPNHRDSLALAATLKLLRGDNDAFEAGMKKLLEVDPTYGRGFHLAGLVVASRQRRYEKALELVKRGLRIQPTNFEAHADVGIFLANLGRADEAIAALQKSIDLFPFSHPIRGNFKLVLKYVTEKMVEQRSEHFVIRYDPSQYDVHHRFLMEALEASWDDMVKRYGFEPDKPVLVECFKTQDDFSVRSIGLPGIPALGACFGGLITLDSPTAFGRPFNWHGTAIHEFAHVITLQLSAGQVPRWFTEGVSVLEEKPVSTGWGREEGYERELADAYLTDTLPKVETFDGMFRSARVGYAYYVGGLMMQMLRAKYGEEGIVKALKLWADDASQAKVFKEAFGLQMDEFDVLFKAEVKKRVDGYRIVPNYGLIYGKLRKQRQENPKDGMIDVKIGFAHLRSNELVDAGNYLDQARRKGVGDKPLTILLDAEIKWVAGDGAAARKSLDAFFAAGGEDFDARMKLARLLASGGDQNSDKVIKHLQQAKKDWPLRAGGANPYTLLYREYMKLEMPKKALQELEQQAAILTDSIPLRLRLAREYELANRDDDALRVLEECIRVSPFVRAVHDALLPLYVASKQSEKAIRAARCRVALRDEEDADEDVAGRWLDLADVLLDAGQAAEARTAFDEAKKLADVETLPRIAEVEKRFGA